MQFQLPSGQWQARYRDPDGLMRPADTAFPTKTDAEVWLTRKEAEILNGDWINPDADKVLLSDYGTTWIEERPNLRPKTIRLYRYLFRRHIQPHFGSVTIADIKEATCGTGARSSSIPESAPLPRRRHTACSKQFSTLLLMTASSAATPAGSKAPDRNSPRSGPS